MLEKLGVRVTERATSGEMRASLPDWPLGPPRSPRVGHQARSAPSSRRGVLERGAPPEDVAHEEGAERLDVLRRLCRAAHRLDEVGQRVQLTAHEADHEVVVDGVEPVADEPDVVREIGVAVRPARARRARAGSRPAPWVTAARTPGPSKGYQIAHGHSGPSAVRRGRSRSQSSRLGLEAASSSVRPNIVSSGGDGDRRTAPPRAPLATGPRRTRVLGEAEDADTQGIVHVGVEDDLDRGPLQRRGEALRVVAVAGRPGAGRRGAG